MKKVIKTAFGLVLGVFAAFECDAAAKSKGSTPHQLSLGLDMFYRDYHEIFTSPGKSDEYGALVGTQFGYDYVKPEGVYCGADVRFAAGEVRYDGSSLSGDVPIKDRTSYFIGNAEARVGYTFLVNVMEKDVQITPLVGLGTHYWDRRLSKTQIETYSWGYYAAGIRTLAHINDRLAIGVNSKVMRMFNARMKEEPVTFKTVSLGNETHFEIEAPIEFKLKSGDKNVLRLVPYYRNQNIGRSTPALGVGIHSGSFFVEPDSQTHVVGCRAEYVWKLSGGASK